MAKFTLGQGLWFVPNDRRHGPPYEVKVTKVGRKWVEISGRMRIDPETMRVDGGQTISPGRCFLSKTKHGEFLAIEGAWRQLHNAIGNSWGVPDRVSLDSIMEAARLLGITIKPPALEG